MWASSSVWSVCPSSSRSVCLTTYVSIVFLSIYLTIPGQDAPQEGGERAGAAGAAGPLPQQADQPP